MVPARQWKGNRLCIRTLYNLSGQSGRDKVFNLWDVIRGINLPRRSREPLNETLSY